MIKSLTLMSAFMVSSMLATTPPATAAQRYIAPKPVVKPISSLLTAPRASIVSGKPAAGIVNRPAAGFAANTNGARIIGQDGNSFAARGGSGLISPGNRTGSSFR